jgi:MinD-like ATPase involved in chromosome partitioning or flagellar assembly
VRETEPFGFQPPPSASRAGAPIIGMTAMAAPPPIVLIASRDPDVKHVVATLQAECLIARSIGTLRELQPTVDTRDRCVAVLDAELAADESFETAEALERLHGIPTLVLLPQDADPLSRTSLEGAGIEEFARKPIVASVLSLRVKALILSAGLQLPAPRAVARGEIGPLDMLADVRGELTVVYSVKGGSGKSTIAANLAAGLSMMYSLNTLLVDANLWFGDLGVLLNLSSARSSFDVCGSDDPDLFALPKAVVRHASGASVLLRPSDPLSVEKIKPRNFVDAIERYRSLYEHVIVDCAAVLDELNLDLLEKATRILLVVIPEMGAVHNATRFLGLAKQLGHIEKITMVLNRANSGINADDLQRTLGMPVPCGIVSAGRMMLDAVNNGTTLFSIDPLRKERITQDLAAVVELIAGREQPPVEQIEPRRGSRLGFLRRIA